MRKLARAAAGLLLMLLLSFTAYAEGDAVTAMRTDCDVEIDGACTVSMQLTLELSPETERFEIPLPNGARNVSCSLPYTLESGEGCRLLRLTELRGGKTELSLSYRVTETVSDDGTAQEFNVQLLYPAWSCPISGYEVTVKLPHSFESMPVFLSGYYGETIDNYMRISIEDGSIHAVLNEKQTLQDHEAMSMKLELQEGFFDLRFLAGKTTGVDRLLFLGFLVLSALYWLIFLRNLPILPKRQAMPPEGGNAGEIPFLLTDRSPDLALMVVQWASLGYLTVTRSRKGRIWLTRVIDMDTERKQLEGEIFWTLFSRGDHCDLRSAEYLKARRMAAEKPREFWQERIYDPRAGAPWVLRLLALAGGLALCMACFDLVVASKSWRWFVIVPLTLLGGAACWALQNLGGFLLRRHSLRTGALALLSGVALLALGRRSGQTLFTLLNLALQVGVGLLLRTGGRRTADGAAMAGELLGYRRWLLSVSSEQMAANLEADPQYFYRVLPFADALQAGRFLAASFDRTRLENCDWLIWEGKPTKTAPGFYARYRRLMAGLRGERDPGAKAKKKPAAAKRPVSTRTPPVRRRPQGSGNKSPARNVKGRKRP